MNIQIRHISNTLNYGSLMMAVTLINKLSNKIENLNFYVDAKTNKDLERIIIESNITNINRERIGESFNIVLRAINKVRRFIINQKIDVVIIIGGDDISEYYGIEALEEELNSLMRLSKSNNIFLVGQTIGPFSGHRGELARRCLEDTLIYTRDENCLEYLYDLGFKNVRSGRDLAFCDLPIQDKSKGIITSYSLNSMDYVTLVMSGLFECYTEDYDKYINEYKRIIFDLLENEKLKDKGIVLLPHVLSPDSVDDRIIIKEIMKDIKICNNDRIITIQDEILASEAREILGNGLFTITGRMHAAVSTLFMRRPAISLSYSVKYAGVIGDGLDMNELVIESSDKELWKYGKISELVNEKVNYVLDNYDELINKIDKNVLETTKITQEQLDDLVREIKKVQNNKI